MTNTNTIRYLSSNIIRTTTTAPNNKTPPPYRIAIVGAGVAGLSCASSLLSLFCCSDWKSNKELQSSLEIVIYDKTKKNINSYDSLSLRDNIGVGLWSTSLQKFAQFSPNVVRDLVDVGRWVGPVSYRTVQGDFLARSHLNDQLDIQNGILSASANKNPFYEYNHMPGLLFVNERELYSALRRDLKRDALRSKSCSILYGRDITDIDFHTGKLLFKNDTTQDQNTYDLIIAADGANSAIRSVGRKYNNSNGCKVKKRGYVVFRGNSPLDLDGQSFQTWGNNHGMRFATCPLPKGHVWFATVDSKHISINHETQEIKSSLLELFSSWHSPIEDLIQSTSSDSIVYNDAVAHTERGLNLDLLTSRPLLHYVGDADICIDPLLAQGFSLAFEDAYSVTSTFQNCYMNDTLKYGFEKVSLQKKGRINAVLHSTTMAQALAQPSGWLQVKLAQNARLLMQNMPSFITTPAFNGMLKYSVGMRPF